MGKTSRRWMRVAGGLLLATALASAGLAVGRHAAATDGVSRCALVPKKVAAPTDIVLGATVRVTLTLDATCPPEAAPVDVVLVLDESGSMGNAHKLANAKVAAKAFVDAMDLSLSRVALVAFNQDAGVRVPLTHDGKRIKAAIDGLIAGGKTNISGAIDVARAELLREPSTHGLAMVVLTDGFNTVSGVDAVPVAAQRAKDAAIKVATFCAGGQCDPDLQPAASDPTLYYNVTDTSRLADLYRALAGALQANAVATLTIRDEIPANMRYVPDSARPVPAEVGANYLVWKLNGLPGPDGLSYDLEPLEVGTHPTNVIATGDIVDRRGLPGQTVFPIPVVHVIAPPCAPTPLEVYFLIDDSNCLLMAYLNEMPAREAIVVGVGRVLDEMAIKRDQAAIIGFGDRAFTWQTLTSSWPDVLKAARAIQMQDNSARLDLAYAEVARQMAAHHRPGAQVVTIAITDGPMNAPQEVTVQRALALRRQGVKHYAIGVGNLIQTDELRRSTEPGGLREIDFGGDAIGSYQDLGALAVTAAKNCPSGDGGTSTPVPTAVPTVVPVATPTSRLPNPLDLPWTHG